MWFTPVGALEDLEKRLRDFNRYWIPDSEEYQQRVQHSDPLRGEDGKIVYHIPDKANKDKAPKEELPKNDRFDGQVQDLGIKQKIIFDYFLTWIQKENCQKQVEELMKRRSVKTIAELKTLYLSELYSLTEEELKKCEAFFIPQLSFWEMLKAGF